MNSHCTSGTSAFAIPGSSLKRFKEGKFTHLAQVALHLSALFSASQVRTQSQHKALNLLDES